MKKINYLILSIILSFTLSCETDSSEIDPAQSENVLVIGEVKNSINEDTNSSSREIQNDKRGFLTRCATNGPECGLPGQILTYTLNTPDIVTVINWNVTSGISIISGQGTNTVTISLDSNFSGGQISVDFNSSICVSPMARNILLCGPGPGPDDCDDYSLGILDEYIDGTQSGANYVYLHAGGNFPNGTTYEWEIRRQNGTIQFYSPSTSNPRLVSASINNRITRATVTAKFEDCEKTVTKTFQCAIPNADINGNLFPECDNLGGGFN